MPELKPVTLTTGRLTLRWMDERDVAAHFAVFSDPEVDTLLERRPVDRHRAVAPGHR
jgi:hypothetical protein